MTTGNVQMGMTKNNHAANMVTEDFLRKIISKTSTKGWNPHDNKFLPRSQHSPFGDFPADYMPKKTAAKKDEVVDEAGKTFKSKTYSNLPRRQFRDCNSFVLVLKKGEG